MVTINITASGRLCQETSPSKRPPGHQSLMPLLLYTNTFLIQTLYRKDRGTNPVKIKALQGVNQRQNRDTTLISLISLKINICLTTGYDSGIHSFTGTLKPKIVKKTFGMCDFGDKELVKTQEFCCPYLSRFLVAHLILSQIRNNF